MRLYDQMLQSGKINELNDNMSCEYGINNKLLSPCTGREMKNYNIHRNSYRSSISTNNTISSPRSKQIIDEVLFDSGNCHSHNQSNICNSNHNIIHNIDNHFSILGERKNNFLLLNQNLNDLSPKNMNLINPNIDEMVVQRFNNKRRRHKIITKIDNDIKDGISISMSNNQIDRNYQNIIKYSSLIDTNSQEFSELPQSIQKKILQMIRNRQSAQKHRDKQKIERQNLIQENINLRARISELTTELQELRTKYSKVCENSELIPQLKNEYRFPEYYTNDNIIDSSNEFVSIKNNSNINSNAKDKIEEYCVKNQEIDYGFNFVPIDNYSNMNIWNAICNNNKGSSCSNKDNTISKEENIILSNENNLKNENICNQIINIDSNIDLIPWVGEAQPSISWNKQNNVGY